MVAQSVPADLRMKAPLGVVFHSEERLMVWQPRGLVDEKTVNEIIRFIGPREKIGSL